MSPFRSPESRGAEARAWLLLLLTAGAAAYPAIWLAGWNPYAGRLRVGAAEAVLNGSDLRIASYQDGRLTAEMRAEAVSAGSGAQAFLLTGMTGSFGDASATASQAVWTPRIGALEASPGLRLKLDGATAVFERTSTITADGWKTDGP
ncbi:MAG: hypothetical protein MH204_08185, partial [Fimbriimonadaceae bacterium]|nr:hypothetical protein [Fimbriimonadaceae bacterium]